MTKYHLIIHWSSLSTKGKSTIDLDFANETARDTWIDNVIKNGIAIPEDNRTVHLGPNAIILIESMVV